MYNTCVCVCVFVCVCVIPCHRVSACWWGSPVAAVVSERAEQSLYELTRTAPGRKRKRQRKGQRKRKRSSGKRKKGVKWKKGEVKEKSVSANQYKSKKQSLCQYWETSIYKVMKYNLCENNGTAFTDAHWYNLITFPWSGSRSIALHFQKLHYSCWLATEIWCKTLNSNLCQCLSGRFYYLSNGSFSLSVCGCVCVWEGTP